MIVVSDGMLARGVSPGSRLLNCPAEILGNIIGHLAGDKCTANKLVLANSECRQLARIVQFNEVQLDYTQQARELIVKLSQETAPTPEERYEPRLGPCIRYVTVQTDANAAKRRHERLYDLAELVAKETVLIEQFRQLNDEVKASYGTYVDDLLSAIVVAMPKLQRLSWSDPHTLGERFFHRIIWSSIKHLKLHETPIDFTRIVSLPPDKESWPLQSLHLQLRSTSDFSRDFDEHTRRVGQNWIQNAIDGVDVSPVVASLLRLCAPTLTSLFLSGSKGDRKTFSSELPFFPCLRRFRFRCLEIAPETLSWIFWASIGELELGEMTDQYGVSIQGPLDECGRFFDLDTLVVHRVTNTTARSMCAFIERHIFLEKVSIGTCPWAILEEKIIPALCSQKFTRLTTLSLFWQAPRLETQVSRINKDSLAAIGTITSLQQLCLGVGEATHLTSKWLIDHHVLRRRFKGLTALKRLVFSGDTPLPKIDAKRTTTTVEGTFQIEIVNVHEKDHVWMKTLAFSQPCHSFKRNAGGSGIRLMSKV